MTYTVWQACPTPCGWEPWEPIAGHLKHPLIAPLLAAEAHSIAQGMRSTFPGHLFAVRPAAAGVPLWPEAMADHYDLPPYAD
jgi:hypothetical protein